MKKIIADNFRFLFYQFHKRLHFLGLAIIFANFAACQNTQTIQKTESKKTIQTQITDGFYNLSSDEQIKLNVTLKEISRTNQSQNFPKANIEIFNGVRRKFINEGLNSRLPVSLKNGEWKINWQTELAQSFTPSAILTANNRIMVESNGVWFLFDENGLKIKNGQLGASGIILDNENFYAADSTGLIWARNLADGADIFGLPLYFGDAFARKFMLRREQKFFTVSTERELDPDKQDKTENSLIELVDLGNPIKIGNDKLLKSSKQLNDLVRKTKILLTAANNQTLVFSTTNRIYLADLNLQIQKAFSGKFIPQTMSLDEAGRIYLTVKKETKSFLWLLLPTGELAMEFELPDSFNQISTPPIVGFDHKIYLLGKDRILAVNQEGKLLWQNEVGKEISGAIITADEQLLVSVENELLAFDGNGQKRVVFTLTDEKITVAPVLTEKGEILITTSKRLYCLSQSY